MRLEEVILGAREYSIHAGDVIPHMLEEMPESCVDFAVTSPPFPSVFAYTDEACDLGNTEDLRHELKIHFGYFFRGLLRVLKPGRVAIIHCTQIAHKKRDDETDLFDFRGTLIRIAKRAGWRYCYDWLVRVNPQAQAIRTRKWELKFQGLEADRSQSRGALGMYLIKLRKPGNNEVPVNSSGQVSRNDWIEWAEDCWGDINETDTLNYQLAKGEKDVRHICPLQLGIIERVIRLYTNPGELVFDPFAGIASTGFVALGGASPKTKRRLADSRLFYGAEIKPEYLRVAHDYCEQAIKQRKEENRTLFDFAH